MQHVLPDAHGTHRVRRWQRVDARDVRISRPDDERAEVGIPLSAVHLESDVERDFAVLLQPDPSAEKGPDVVVQAKPE